MTARHHLWVFRFLSRAMAIKAGGGAMTYEGGIMLGIYKLYNYNARKPLSGLGME